MLKNFKKAVTLLELLVVLSLIGIIALMSVPRYLRGMEQSRDGEIQALLRLVAAAERIYEQEKSTFIPCSDTANCIAALNIDLHSDDWDYSVESLAANTFTAKAQRVGGPDPTRRWEMTEADDSPACLNSSLCP